MTMAADEDDNEVNGNGARGNDDGYVNIIKFKLIIANLYNFFISCFAPFKNINYTLSSVFLYYLSKLMKVDIGLFNMVKPSIVLQVKILKKMLISINRDLIY